MVNAGDSEKCLREVTEILRRQHFIAQPLCVLTPSFFKATKPLVAALLQLGHKNDGYDGNNDLTTNSVLVSNLSTVRIY